MSRQQVRRELFIQSVARMPMWETWTRENVIARSDGKVRDARDFKPVPRRTRRSMARGLAKRGWEVVKGQ